jgi:hypothetical protein
MEGKTLEALPAGDETHSGTPEAAPEARETEKAPKPNLPPRLEPGPA